ncbi:Uncharacterised protein [Bordetella pertussis]|nr:Uncharacterised protein [Bordetella pertussis]CFU10059.1 Uncharacterised protein [Bordetella pertussis]
MWQRPYRNGSPSSLCAIQRVSSSPRHAIDVQPSEVLCSRSPRQFHSSMSTSGMRRPSASPSSSSQISGKAWLASCARASR